MMGAPARIGLWTSLILLVAVAVWLVWPDPVIERAPGALCPEMPVQTPPSRATPWLHGDFMITALADYEISAVVLSREEYHSGKAAELSPVDLALGWGRMSDSFVYEKLDISQGHRWYKWEPDGLEPIPRREIERSSANVHILPANESVRDALDEVHRGSIVRMQGSLVKATMSNGWHWVSSTTRDDTGDGACEVFWVESLIVEN
ncbi:MAG: hypothetical protein RBU27_03610 [Bacteroidota bacterium]|jgi:hypothetical protein|nr:hypothetical protein [Bacteroidota bacterium]